MKNNFYVNVYSLFYQKNELTGEIETHYRFLKNEGFYSGLKAKKYAFEKAERIKELNPCLEVLVQPIFGKNHKVPDALELIKQLQNKPVEKPKYSYEDLAHEENDIRRQWD